MNNQERNRESLIEHIAEQDRIIRRRNEQIAQQAENAREAQDIIEDYQAKLSDLREDRARQAKTITQLQENSRPLTAADLSEEAIRRARVAWLENARGEGCPSAPTIRAMFTAALTPPPSREAQEAVKVEALIAEFDEFVENEADFLIVRADLARWLTERGVRVTGKDN